MTSFSIIVCTYNPNFEIFKRLIQAISKFEYAQIEYEVIIVDNNSSPKLSQNKSIHDLFINKDKCYHHFCSKSVIAY